MSTEEIDPAAASATAYAVEYGDPAAEHVLDLFEDRLRQGPSFARVKGLDRSEVAASILGSMAAALECECDGNIPIGRSDLLGRIDMVEKHARFE